MQTMFISRALSGTSGAVVGARMHLNALKAAVGEENVFVIDLSVGSKPERKDRYIAYGKYKSKAERIKRNIEGNSFYISNAIINEICEIINHQNIAFVFVDDSVFGHMVKSIKQNCKKTRVVTFFHDVKAELYPKWMSRSKWIDRINWNIEMKQEKESVYHTDANIVLNKAEDDLLSHHYGRKADYYLSVSVDKAMDCSENPYIDNNKRHILFVGTAYKPNIDGLKWFYDNVYPSIRNSFDIWVVGKGLEILKERYSDCDVHIVGFVNSITGYYSYADVVIAPLTDGGGMKIKTAEAVSYGKTFVGTSESLRGYYEELPQDLIDSVVYQCDTASEFIDAFNNIQSKQIDLNNPILIDLYEKKYSREAAILVLKRIIKGRGRKN